MIIARSQDLKRYKSSLFLFGPRMTGKTSLLATVKTAASFDLLSSANELSYKENPEKFWKEIRALAPGSVIALDEIQKVPALLNYVQMGIEQYKHRFLMSGSSARKLRRGSANLLGGRAIECRLHPLSVAELGAAFDLELALSYGTLPKIYSLANAGELDEMRALLGSYYTTYIQQEIQAEALIRNVPAFQRFLRVAAQSNAHIIEYANISRTCQVDDSTVKGYYEILEDTLMGAFHFQWNASERKKSRPKFYFFDTGVVRALQNRLYDAPTLSEMGLLYETWFIRELVKIKDYSRPYFEFCYWRDRNDEVDVLCSRGGCSPSVALELKSGLDDEISESTARKFKAQFPRTKLVIASRLAERPRRGEHGVEVLPWRMAMEMVAAEV